MNKVESGLQLLNRLNERPSLNEFDRILFPNGGPFPKEVIEVTGESNTGKTILLIEIIAKAVLPLKNGGRNAGVIFINTNHHFQIIQLINVMERIINDFTNDGQNVDTGKVISESLRNVRILQCHDAVQLSVTFKSIAEMLAINNITVLILDSIAAYYWSEQVHKTTKMDIYYKTNLNALQKATWEYNTILFYTRPMYFYSQGLLQAEKCNNFSEHPKLHHINYRITLEVYNDLVKKNIYLQTPISSLHSDDHLKKFIAKVQTVKTQYSNKYNIRDTGISWIT